MRRATTTNRVKLSKKAQQLLARRKSPRLPSPTRPKTDNLDPTRTATLRRAFLAKLNKRFAILKGRIVRYVALEDNFDLTTNEQLRDALGRFASGGLTPFKVGQIVGLTAHHAGLIKSKATEIMDKVPGAKWMRTKVAAINTKLKERYGAKQAGAIVASGVAISWGVFIGGAVAGVPLYVPTLAAMVPGACLAELHYQLRGKKQRTEPAPAANVVTDGVPSGPKEQLSDVDITRLAHELLAEIEHIWADRPDDTVTNCNPGQMRGADGKCGPGVGIGIDRENMPQIPGDKLDDFVSFTMSKGVSVERSTVQADKLGPTQAKFRQERVDSIPDDKLTDPILVSEDNRILDGTHRWVKHWQRDKQGRVPVLRIGLDVHAALDLMRLFDGVKYAANSFSQEPFTANAGQHAFLSDADKLEAFQRWLDQQLADTLLGKDQEQLWHQFIRQGFGKGAGRSYDDVRTPPTGPSRIRPSSTKGRSRKARTDLQGYIKGYSQDQSTADFYSGTKSEFLNSAFNQPVSQEKLDLLASRAFDEMEGMAGDMANRLSRTLADGLTAGDSPHDVAARMSDELDISRDRAETIARTELIRAHAEGQLLSLEKLGVTELGVAVEWSNSGLNTVDKKGRPISPCARCKALSGVVLKLSEAHGLIPFHPRCQCAWLPAGLGEDTSDQLLTKEEIDAAFIEAEADPVPDIDEDRPVSGLPLTSSIIGNNVFSVNTEDTDILALNRELQEKRLLDGVFGVIITDQEFVTNWCNQYGGTTCKEGSKGYAAQKAKDGKAPEGKGKGVTPWDKETKTAPRSAKTKTPQHTVDSLHAEITRLKEEGNPSSKDVKRVATAIATLKVKDIKELKARLGKTASGNKQDMANSLAVKSLVDDAKTAHKELKAKDKEAAVKAAESPKTTPIPTAKEAGLPSKGIIKPEAADPPLADRMKSIQDREAQGRVPYMTMLLHALQNNPQSRVGHQTSQSVLADLQRVSKGHDPIGQGVSLKEMTQATRTLSDAGFGHLTPDEVLKIVPHVKQTTPKPGESPAEYHARQRIPSDVLSKIGDD